MDDADAKRAAEQQQLQNPFPTPPSYWNRYTPNNLRLLALLRSAQTDQPDEELDQEGVLKQLGEDSELLPSFPLVTLEPPRLDWVLEKGKYAAFGEVYSTSEEGQFFPPSVPRLYNLESGADPRPFLRQCLVSTLSAYHKLLGELVSPVPEGYYSQPPGQREEDYTRPPPNWEHIVLWLRTLGMNFMFGVNELRPIQARMTLESLMRRQIEVRREETKSIHDKCDELERNLTELRGKVAALLPSEKDASKASGSSFHLGSEFPAVDSSHLLAWSQE